MKKIKLMTVFGTRPEAIKMCPLVLEMQKYPDFIEPIVAVTAQHREMLDQVLQLFKITPDYDLNIMTAGQTLYDVTGRALAGLKDVLAASQPDMVLVHGDTTTTFVGALASFYAQIPVGACGSRAADGQQIFALSRRNEPQADRCHCRCTFCTDGYQ